MSNLKLINDSCMEQEVDAIVNAANKYLAAGGGICGAIFNKAGYMELTHACSQVNTPLQDGEAAITPAFGIKNAKYIIHAVGPDFNATPEAFKELFEAYYHSLIVLKNNNLHSIAFPLISAGIFGGALANPVKESTKQCYQAYKQFCDKFPDYAVNVVLCAFSQKEMKEAQDVFKDFSI